MARLRLRCVDRDYRDELWTLKLLGRRVVLEDEAGEVMASFPRRRAEDNFTLPSFWKSIKHLGVKLDDGNVAWFAPTRQAVALIKEYRDDALADRGPAAVAGLRNRGLGELLAGVALLVGAVVLTVWFVAEGARGPERRLPIALALFACFALARGVYDLLRAGRVRRRLDEEGEDDDDDDD
jgi:hypothetical protein